MNSTAKKLLHRHAPWLAMLLKLWRLCFHRDSYLRRSGLLHSYKKGMPVTRDGKALPWMNYDVIEFLEERLAADQRLFEYGSGYSTQFYAGLAGTVISVEHDAGWFGLQQGTLPPQARLIHIGDSGEYASSIDEENEPFDVVVIDGIERESCARAAVEHLTERGVIILDDSSRLEYSEIVAFLLSRGFRQLSFRGLKPNGFCLDATSIFYRDGNCLGI